MKSFVQDIYGSMSLIGEEETCPNMQQLKRFSGSRCIRVLCDHYDRTVCELCSHVWKHAHEAECRVKQLLSKLTEMGSVL